MTGFWTEKRKTIALNALAFGLISGASAVATALVGGTSVDQWQVLVTAFLSGLLGGAVGYFNSKSDEFETGAKAGAKKGIRIGVR